VGGAFETPLSCKADLRERTRRIPKLPIDDAEAGGTFQKNLRVSQTYERNGPDIAATVYTPGADSS
jgi:hypothetical protein